MLLVKKIKYAKVYQITLIRAHSEYYSREYFTSYRAREQDEGQVSQRNFNWCEYANLNKLSLRVDQLSFYFRLLICNFN